MLKTPKFMPLGLSWTAALALASVATTGCSPVSGDMETSGSVVLADLGTDGNAKAIAQYNEFKGKLDAEFVRPEPGTQAIFFSGFRPFEGGTQNVSGQTVQYMAKTMTTGLTTTRSVDGGILTRGTVMQNGKPYTAYFFEGDTNFATPALVAASVEAIKPVSVINMGQTQAASRVEIGATNRANTSVPGYDSEGNVSQQFGTNKSGVVDESNPSARTTVYAPDAIRNFASSAKLPLSQSATTTGDYLCNATSYASLLAASNYESTPNGFQPLPGLKMGGDKALGTSADQTQNSSVVGFVHVNQNEVPEQFGPRILESAVANVPEPAAQPTVVTESTAGESAMPKTTDQASQTAQSSSTNQGEPVIYEGSTPQIGLH